MLKNDLAAAAIVVVVYAVELCPITRAADSHGTVPLLHSDWLAVADHQLCAVAEIHLSGWKKQEQEKDED